MQRGRNKVLAENLNKKKKQQVPTKDLYKKCCGSGFSWICESGSRRVKDSIKR
jgi:hypothetical protein